MNNYRNIGLSNIAKSENLSVRTYNICKYNQLLNLNAILQYYFANNDFMGIRNCGKRTNRELITICVKHKKSYLLKAHQKTNFNYRNREISRTIKNLTVKQTNIINCIVVWNIRKLLPETTKVISSYLGNSISIKRLHKYIFSNSYFETRDLIINNKKVKQEIEFFLYETMNLIKHISEPNISGTQKGKVNNKKEIIWKLKIY